MKEKICIIWYLALSRLMLIYRQVFYRKRRYRPKTICGIKVHSAQEGNEELFKMIQSGKPFAAIRYGANEMSTFLEGRTYQLGLRKNMRQCIADNAWRQSGFFPNDVSLMPRYADVMAETSREIDFLASYATRMENYMVSSFMKKDVYISDNRAIEPYYFQHNSPWSRALKGKKVLIIHPFAETIKKQYEVRDKLFEDKDILPDFDLYCVKAVQTIVGTKDDRFENWFEALEYMYNEAMKIDFDIALLGCGAYGQPLACMLKKAGKQAIHIGGGTQILFGIKGRRWELNSKEIPAMFNEYWVRPSEAETPKNKSQNEFGGSYW